MNQILIYMYRCTLTPMAKRKFEGPNGASMHIIYIYAILSSRSRFFSKLAVSFLRPPIPRSRIEFIFLVLVNVPFGHLTLCRTLIPTKSIQTFNQVFRRNYHLEFKKKWCNFRYFLYVWNVQLWLLIRFLFHLHHSKWQFRRKLIACGTVLSITREILQLNNNKTFIFSFWKCR